MDFDQRNIKREKSVDFTLAVTVEPADYKIEDLFSPSSTEAAGLFQVTSIEGNASIRQEERDTEYSTEPDIKIKEEALDEDSILQKPAKRKSRARTLPATNRFICFNCRASFNTKLKLMDHSKVHSSIKLKNPYDPTKDEEAEKKRHRCQKCPWRFISKKSLGVHYLRAHSDTRPFHCDFPSCEKSFKSLNETNDHKRSVHISVRPHKCLNCVKSFKLIHQLSEHQLRVHEKPKERKFGCKICKNKFFFQLDLKVHEKRSHLK